MRKAGPAFRKQRRNLTPGKLFCPEAIILYITQKEGASQTERWEPLGVVIANKKSKGIKERPNPGS